MMDNFTYILQLLPTIAKTPSTCNHFRGARSFRVQVKFYIPLFDGKIDGDTLDKWLNLLEGYYSTKKNLNIENITFAPLKALLHVKNW
jgi:hypothetical protein